MRVSEQQRPEHKLSDNDTSLNTISEIVNGNSDLPTTSTLNQQPGQESNIELPDICQQQQQTLNSTLSLLGEEAIDNPKEDEDMSTEKL